jgi:TolA-binding protein
MKMNDFQLPTPSPRNGTSSPAGQSPEELAVAHGIASYQQLRSHRDELQKKVEKLEQLLTVSKIEVEGLRTEHQIATSRIESYQHERDAAVADLAIYQSLFISLQSMLKTFGIDNALLVKKFRMPTGGRNGNDAPA